MMFSEDDPYWNRLEVAVLGAGLVLLGAAAVAGFLLGRWVG